MSENPEDEGIPFLPMEPAEFVRAAQEARARAHMEQEDATNRVRALIEDELSTDQLDALRVLLTSISTRPLELSNFWEGRVSGILAERHRQARMTAEEHAFVDDTVDLDNPYCAWVDPHGTRCNLPPANGRHHQ